MRPSHACPETARLPAPPGSHCSKSLYYTLRSRNATIERASLLSAEASAGRPQVCLGRPRPVWAGPPAPHPQPAGSRQAAGSRTPRATSARMPPVWQPNGTDDGGASGGGSEQVPTNATIGQTISVTHRDVP